MKEYICKEVPTDNGGYLEPVSELIRCKDCAWYDKNDIFKNIYGEENHLCIVTSYYVGGEHYCATAKRREECSS